VSRSGGSAKTYRGGKGIKGELEVEIGVKDGGCREGGKGWNKEKGRVASSEKA